ncbi:MAG: hypothetical protein CML99_13060 [Rhodobiaceae bacterium]|nr:hypothetical protein [Rhodobiaceae bacterium]
MSAGITVRARDHAGGAQRAGQQDFFLVEGEPVVLRGDPVMGHGLSPHANPVMAEGSDWMCLDGIPVCRAGHQATCGHATSGRPWFRLPGDNA